MPEPAAIPAQLSLSPNTTAFVVIDLQKGILAMPAAPHSTTDVIRNAAAIAARCRSLGIPVVLVTVGFRADNRDRLMPPTDAAARVMPLTADATTLAPELQADPADIYIRKHQWGAFYGTDLDLQLRRRGIDTMVLCGIATNMGVESTARDAWERNYNVVFVEDAMSSMNADMHTFSVSSIFPRIGRVRSTADVLAALG